MTIEDDTGTGPASATPPAPGPRAGWWPSPWSAAQVAGGKVSRSGLGVDGTRVSWTEGRPDQGGRQVVVGVEVCGAGPSGGRPRALDRPVDRTPPGVGVRSRVHEYGGGAATVAGGVLFYVDQDDQAWYRMDPVDGARPLRLGGRSDPGDAARHGDGAVTPDGRWLVSVEERVGPARTTHTVVAMATDGSGATSVVVEDGDFVVAPRPSPDGRWLAWVSWDHPDMSWDASRVRVARLRAQDGSLVADRGSTIAGGSGVAVGQPRWTADGALLFVDDRTGWWVPYRVPARAFADSGPRPSDAVALVGPGAEYHGPDWGLAQHTLDQLPDARIVSRRTTGGRDGLVVLTPPADGLDAPGWTVAEVDQPCVGLTDVAAVDDHTVAVLGSTATEAHVVLAVDLSGGGTCRLSTPPVVDVPVDRASPSDPWTATVDGRPVPGVFFAPVNPDVVEPGGPPPLVVFCHGGPTGAAAPGYDPVVQFLTSRGIAVASVDYRGSSGYGREYRDALRGQWGVADVDDCVAYASALADAGRVDGSRMAIRGTSAGGLTALAALVRARVFAGAVSWYGVTDLGALAVDTHDFESRYLDGLVGPLPESAAVYRDRSPIHHAADLSGRVLLLQGSDDPIVPLGQAESFAAELRAGGADCRLVVFDGESHGFRRAATIEAALTEELDFYRDLFAPEATGGR